MPLYTVVLLPRFEVLDELALAEPIDVVPDMVYLLLLFTPVDVEPPPGRLLPSVGFVTVDEP